MHLNHYENPLSRLAQHMNCAGANLVHCPGYADDLRPIHTLNNYENALKCDNTKFFNSSEHFMLDPNHEINFAERMMGAKISAKPIILHPGCSSSCFPMYRQSI